MEKVRILIDLNEFEDKSTLSAFMKSTALKEDTYQFDVRCSNEDFAVLSDSKDIVHIDEFDKANYDMVLTSHKEKEDRLLFLSSEQKKGLSYLLILDENEDKETKIKSFIKAKKIVDDHFGKPVVFSLISENLNDAIPEEEMTNKGETAHIEDLFSYEKEMIVISNRDFDFVDESIACFSKLLSIKKNDKKSVFSSIGDYFFKNYTSKPENVTLKDYLSVYEILLNHDNWDINIIRKPLVGDYFSLLNLIQDKE